VTLVPNYNILEAKFTIHNTIATLLHNHCQQINIKTEKLYCFAFVLCKNHRNKVSSGRNWQKLGATFLKLS